MKIAIKCRYSNNKILNRIYNSYSNCSASNTNSDKWYCNPLISVISYGTRNRKSIDSRLTNACHSHVFLDSPAGFCGSMRINGICQFSGKMTLDLMNERFNLY